MLSLLLPLTHSRFHCLLKRGALVALGVSACALAACGSSVVKPNSTPTPRTIQHPQLTYMKHTGAVFGAWWSPNGARLVSTSQDMTAQVWDASTGARSLDLMGYSSGVTWADWSPDGARIVTSGGYASGISSAADSVAKSLGCRQRQDRAYLSWPQRLP